jgi:hypothetical protein
MSTGDFSTSIKKENIKFWNMLDSVWLSLFTDDTSKLYNQPVS